MNHLNQPESLYFVHGRAVRLAWMTLTVIAAVSLITLAFMVRANPESQLDQRLLDDIGSWGASALGGWYNFISSYSGQWPAVLMTFGALLVTLLVTRMNVAISVAITFGVVGAAGVLAGLILGLIAGVDRPGGGENSFPSGHVTFVTTASILLLYLAWHKRFHPIILGSLIPLFGFLMFSSGISRIFQADHWPSDVLGGYILGVLGPLFFIPLYHRLERIRWVTAPQVGVDVPAPESPDAIIAGSYGSAVVLEPSKGTATKYFDPPVMLRALYWVSFQKAFPYVHNKAAIEAAIHRRRIAGLITKYWFQEDLVSQITDVEWHDGKASMVTQLVPGVEPESNVVAWDFLSAVEVLFEEAGLPGWQLNPHNPHAHTNLVRRPDGKFVIIDMESGFVTPFPSKSLMRSSLKHGTLPVFDDIDFDRLREFAEERKTDLLRTLGEAGHTELLDSIEKGEAAYVRWHQGEPRIWGRIIRWTYRALNIRADFSVARRGLAGGQHKAVSFLGQGLSRWEGEGRITTEKAGEVRESLADPAVAVALEHLGAQMMMSIVFRFPLGSIIRVLWVLTFMVRAADATVRRRPNSSGGLGVHNPLVLIWAALPGIGLIAYMFSRPLLKPVLMRLALDQALHSLPCRLYERTLTSRWLPPRVRAQVIQH